MSKTLRSFLLAAALASAPLVGAMAQANGPTGNYSGTQTSPAKPGSAASATASGLNTATTPYAAPTAPGATGRTVVPGNNSSVAGDVKGTATAKTGEAGNTR